jgi:hypothetical protein
MGRRAVAADLQTGDRPVLEGWEHRRKTAQALAMRARIVLKAADGVRWMDCWTNPVLVSRARLPMQMLSGF